MKQKEIFINSVLRHSLFFVVLLLSCAKSNKEPVLSGFNKVIEISSSVSKIQSTKLGEIVDMLIVDTVLVVNEMFNDSIFKLFNVKSGKYLCSSIRTGRGPNEMVYPRAIHHLKDDIVTTYCENQKALFYISINNFLSRNNSFLRVVKFNRSDILRAYPINDSLSICTGMFKEGRYCLYNLNSNIGNVKYNYPSDDIHNKESNLIKAFAFQGGISIKPDLKKFVSVTYFAGNIEIFDIVNNDFVRTYKHIYYLPQYKDMRGKGAAFIKKNKNGFISLATSNDYIFVLYSGRSKEEYSMDYYCGNNLLVFDWSGKAIMSIKLDKSIRDMTLDRKNMKIYAYSINNISGEPEIISYIIPKL